MIGQICVIDSSVSHRAQSGAAPGVGEPQGMRCHCSWGV